MEFTFYGDLLGIGAAYRLSANAAYEKLNDFYNVTFRTLNQFCDHNHNHVEMFSDSLLITGYDTLSALPDIALVFTNLIRRGLLLRGAIVQKRLSYDARVTKPNFEKRLPEDDTLARAVGLEKMQKGARFLIEPALANQLMWDFPNWLTHEGYITTAGLDGPSSLRRICPTPDSNSYEYLYYWSDSIQLNEYRPMVNVLKTVMAMCDKTTREHFEETIGVIQRAQQRQRATSERLEQGSSVLSQW
jgi:hypothetical protein